MKSWMFIALALLAGGLSPVQGGLNSQMGRILGHPLRGTLLNFCTGGILLCVLLILFAGFPSRQGLARAPWYLFTAGFVGVLFVTTFLVAIPEVGALRVISAAVVGQLVISAVIDHYGWLAVPIQPLSAMRTAGIACLLVGLYLVTR